MGRDRKEYLRIYDKTRRDRSVNKRLNKKYRALSASIIKCIKEGTPCADCGQYFPHYVMQFDHLDGNPNKRYVTRLAIKLKDALDEMEKCELVCANCHCIRTHKRGQNRQNGEEWPRKEAD